MSSSPIKPNKPSSYSFPHQYPNMVSLEKIQTIPKSPEHNSSPRISFSSDFLDEKNFISISPTPPRKSHLENTDKGKSRATDFEFLSNNNVPSSQKMITADELFFEGKLLPFWEIQHVEQLGRISLGKSNTEKMEEEIFKKKENNNNNNIVCNSNNNNSNSNNNNGGRVWFIDDDPSPRPPKCTVLWKELLRLKKQRAAASSLSPSSSSSSSSTSSAAFGDLPIIEEGKEGSGKREKHVKRVKKGLERTRSASIRIRPMVNVPVCAQGKSNGGLAPLFSLKKGRLGR